MFRKALVVLGAMTVALVALSYVLYVRNPAPAAPPVSEADASNPARPYVVKLHAQWCAVCMATKDVWSDIEKEYASRANLVVWDFTNDANTDESRIAAGRLGLKDLFDEYVGETGTVVVLDGRTRQVAASIHGSRDIAEYRSAIDAVLAGAPTDR
jgi:thiol-disulfide isomerase/thioredoxin